MFEKLFGIEAQRKRASKAAKHPVMQEYLGHPFPDTSRLWQECELVSLDLETTGLDPARDRIVSYGMVDIIHGSVHLDTACHQIVRVRRPIPESSAIIHHITDDIADTGISIHQALPEILQHLAGKAMLVHFSRIEQQFLDRACRKLYGSPFIAPTIDTMRIGERALLLGNYTILPTELRLFNLRRRYGLPQYKAHNALSDAVATAELFLALAAETGPDDTTKLEMFLN